MTEPKQLTEEMPETPQDLSNRGLILSDGKVNAKKVITEDLPQDEDEDEDEDEDDSSTELLTED